MSAISKSCGAAAALVAGVCVPLATNTNGGPNAVFLCKTADAATQVEPYVFGVSEGLAALASGGYSQPDAVKGGSGKTKLGDYTLTCQKTGLVVTPNFADESGEVVTPEGWEQTLAGQGNTLDLYPIAVGS